MTSTESVCISCQATLLKVSKINVTSLKNCGGGKFLTRFSRPGSQASRSSCGLCQTLWRSRVHGGNHGVDALCSNGEGGRSSQYELRLFSFLKCYDGINLAGVNQRREIGDAAVFAVVPAAVKRLHLVRLLKSQFWEQGFLICNNISQSSTRAVAARRVSRLFEPKFSLECLDYCSKNHADLCNLEITIPELKVIDCESRRVVFAPAQTKYTALSYRWAQKSLSTHSGHEEEDKHVELPLQLPQVIEDAITVTKALGIRYLWVDKYCIDQRDGEEKQKQIKQMDLIYKGSAVTIIAAYGDDENTGLPGVGRTERSMQPVFSSSKISVVSTMPHPHYKVKRSTWIRRGWTMQEAVLAPRRLVFTQDQVYFECNGMNCYESLYLPLDLLHVSTKEKFCAFMRGGLFTGRDEGLQDPIFGSPFGNFDDRGHDWSYHFKKYLILTTNYTARELTNDEDSLNAFAGIINDFSTSQEGRFDQVLGIPYLCRRYLDDMLWKDCIIAGLCWRHIRSCWDNATEVRRRQDFPTWTPFGWAGTASWTDLFTFAQMDLRSVVDNLNFQSEDGALLQLTHSDPSSWANNVSPKLLLCFSAWIVPPHMISLSEVGGHPSWKIDDFNLRLHVSIFEGTPNGFLTSLENDKIRAYYVAKGNFHSYFLIVEMMGHLARRIGVGEAEWNQSFVDGEYIDHRFEDEDFFRGIATKQVSIV